MNKEKRAWLWPFLLAATIFTLSGASKVATPDLGFQLSKDKIGHFLVFGLLATSVLRTPGLVKRGWQGAVIAAMITITYGGLDEWRQSFTPNRSVEFADWIADTAGAIVATTLYHFVRPYRRILEFRITRPRK